MVTKRGTKRKANGTTVGSAETLTPPDRNTWPGWVEMESEPALFNVMLREMGVRGIKVQELYSIDDDMLAFLPQPVHALIFLFRYRAQDEQTNGATSCPEHVWFANQIPDFACATVALINIINNVPDLGLRPELREFKTTTQGLDPMERGYAVDHFDFVRRIHNSFASEADLLNADMHMKSKLDRFKKKLAAAKASATRAANKAAKAHADHGPQQNSTAGTPDRASKRVKRPTGTSTNPDDEDCHGWADGNANRGNGQPNGESADPTTPDPPRRSTRKPKPRQDVLKTNTADIDDEEDSGYHFIAYMPIDGHVWRLDGMDHFPQDLGEVGDGGSGNWLHIAQAAMAQRMAQFEGGDSFNVMAVVHDPATHEREKLVRNIASIRAFDHRLDELSGDWREMEGAETNKEVITGPSEDLAVSSADLNAAMVDMAQAKRVASSGDILELLSLRREVLSEQPPLRGQVRDALRVEREDEEEARHRRHDYGAFIRAWLHALAEAGMLADVVTEE